MAALRSRNIPYGGAVDSVVEADIIGSETAHMVDVSDRPTLEDAVDIRAAHFTVKKHNSSTSLAPGLYAKISHALSRLYKYVGGGPAGQATRVSRH